MATCREALESIVDLITAFPYIRSVFQNVGASVAIDRLDAVNRALDERTAFIFEQAFEAIFPSDLNDVSLRMHYSRASHANADKSDLSKNFRGLLRLCQSLWVHFPFDQECALITRLTDIKHDLMLHLLLDTSGTSSSTNNT